MKPAPGLIVIAGLMTALIAGVSYGLTYRATVGYWAAKQTRATTALEQQFRQEETYWQQKTNPAP